MDKIRSMLGVKTRLVCFEKGQEIVTVFDKASFCYVVFEGEYEELNYSSQGKKSLLAIRAAPQLIGIVPLAEKIAYHQTDMIATRKTWAVEIENQYFLNELEKNGRLGILIIRNLTGKVIDGSNKIKYRNFFNTKENLMFYLYEHWEKAGRRSDGFIFHIKYSVIADELGVSERTLYRIIKSLKNEAMLTVAGGNIHLNIPVVERFIAQNE